MVMDLSGQHVVAGCMLVAAAFLSYIFLVGSSHSFVDLRALMNLGWLFGAGLGIMKLSRLHGSWTWDTRISVGGFFACFLIGSLLPVRKGTKRRRAADTDRMYLAVLIMTGLSLLAFVAEALILGYIPIFSKLIHAYNYFHVSGVHYFTVSSIFTHCFTLTYIQEMRKRKQTIAQNRKYALIAANVISLAINIMCLGKLNIILSVAFPLFIILCTLRVKDFRKLDWAKIALYAVICLAVFAGVFVAFTKLRHYEPGYLQEIFSFYNADTPVYVQYPYMYVANNFANFNLMTQQLPAHTWGLRSIFPVLALTGLKFVFPQYAELPLYLVKQELNTLTLIYDFYYDFGIAGVLVAGILIGWLASVISSYVRKGGPAAKILFCQIAIYFALSFFTTWFSNATTWFWLAITFAYALFIRGREKAHGAEHEK